MFSSPVSPAPSTERYSIKVSSGVVRTQRRKSPDKRSGFQVEVASERSPVFALGCPLHWPAKHRELGLDEIPTRRLQVHEEGRNYKLPMLYKEHVA